MPHFFFNIHDGQGISDHEGQDLPDWATAQHLAIRYAGEVIQNDVGRINADEDWRMEVTDEAGLVLFHLDFNVVLAPALMSAKGSAAAKPRPKPNKY